MIANLLESHQEGQYQALALNALRFLELFGKFLYRLLVEYRLLTAEVTESLDLGFVRQVSDDRLVGFQPS